jgi:hypothetical protein
MKSRILVPLSLLALILILPSDGSAQIKASERGANTQTIDGTTITLDYGRPAVGGRTELWGGVVPWGKVWTPGANWATTIETNRNITVNGHELSAGKHSVWMQLQPESWTLIFHPEPHLFHLMGPAESEDQVRFEVDSEGASHTELLTWSFPEVRATGAILEMAWGETRVALDIGVTSTQPSTVAADVAEQLIGDYRFTPAGPLGDQPVDFSISYDSEQHLVADWSNAPVPRLLHFWLAPLGSGMFIPVELEGNEIFGMVTDLVFEFDPLEGRAQTIELRAMDDALWGSGVRR